ncbi:hypothetical protein WKK05_41670 (plasmid) [Nostoc sp. UHCC 0302]|uniref:hypothetical protein n=1 Tax=Nostoc sp. UHCC 0302 TaxID=3134896 RepID=UPI00311CD756
MSYFSFGPELSILVFSSLYVAYQFLSQFLITQVLTSRRRSEVSADACTVLGTHQRVDLWQWQTPLLIERSG